MTGFEPATLDPQFPAACSPQFANDRILSDTNDLDTGERSRTPARSAPWLHIWLHDLSAQAFTEASENVSSLHRAGERRRDTEARLRGVQSSVGLRQVDRVPFALAPVIATGMGVNGCFFLNNRHERFLDVGSL